MSDEASARLGLPLLQPGQAQKELYHNEALALLELAVQPVVESVGVTTPPAAPSPGTCWIVGAGGTGEWAGHDGAIAGWTGGGWRLLEPFEGMAVWSRLDQRPARYRDGAWRIASPAGGIAEPAGGATVDDQARAAIVQILALLRRNEEII